MVSQRQRERVSQNAEVWSHPWFHKERERLKNAERERGERERERERVTKC